MSDICIRPAQPSDRNQLLRFREALWPKVPVAEHARELAQILEGKAPVVLPLIILVAEARDRTLAGFLEVDLRSHADGCNPSRAVGYIEGWYVTENYRHRGVGRQLLAEAERRLGTQPGVRRGGVGHVDRQRNIATSARGAGIRGRGPLCALP